MASRRPKTVLYRRRREGKTDYNKKLKQLLAKKPRLVVRFTNTKIIAQIIEFSPSGDLVKVALDSNQLKKMGWNYSLKNLPAAYLTGLLIGKKAQEKKIKETVFDVGFKTPRKKGKVFAFLKGALDSGLDIPHGEEIFPTEEAISGKVISDYALNLKENNDVYNKKFSENLKSKALPEKMTEMFEKVKKEIMG